jgi:hypothetical protein
MAAANPGGSPSIGPHSYLEWARMILNTLGFNDAPNSEVALVCWMVKEGSTSGGSSNPLNTKQPMPKAKQLPNGVYAYDSDDDGLKATVTTLKNGHYNAIVSALKNDTDYVTTCRYIDSSVWGTKGATAVAVGVKASGGAAGALYKGYARRNVPTTGHSVFSGVPGGGAITSAESAIGSVGDALGSIGDFIGVLSDPHTWYRVGQVLFGAILVALGFYAIARNTSVAQAAMGAAGNVKGKRGKSSGGAAAPKPGTELEVAAA